MTIRGDLNALVLRLLPRHEWSLGPCVYFIGCGEFVKIGWTSSLPQRVKALATANPYPLEILAAFEGGIDIEAAFHAAFSQYRCRLEWFFAHGSLGEFLASEPLRVARDARTRASISDFALQYAWLSGRLSNHDPRLAEEIARHAAFSAQNEDQFDHSVDHDERD